MIKLNPVWSLALLSLAVGLTPLLAVGAQAQRNAPLKVSSVATQAAGNGTLVSIAADGSLSQAQTWQDSDGYHVVVPYASAENSVKPSRGVRVRRIGKSLEILVQTKPGANVSVQTDDNRLSLTISGKLDPRAETATDSQYSGEDNSGQAASPNPKPVVEVPRLRLASAAEDLSFTSKPSNLPLVTTKAGPPTLQPRTSQELAQLQKPAPVAADSEIELQPEEDGLFASIFSSTSVLVILALGIFGLLVSRKLRSRQTASRAGVSQRSREQDQWEEEADDAIQSLQPVPQRHASEKKSQTPQPHSLANRGAGAHLAVATPDSLYGAYRIDQEVGKLVLGQPHRMDVLSSRAPEDRRAIETSLIKMIASSPDENERRRASEALEEYGFVARECATLLMSADAFDRTTAARSLGEIKSPAALPFLLEGLYDSEPIVRNQAVASIGELKVPRAIGALLDMARRHPDVPGSLVSKALSACSVEGLDFFDTTISEPAMLGDGRSEGSGCDFTKLEPAAAVEDLPADSDDEGLAEGLSGIQSQDPGERLDAAKNLARYQVGSSVSALTSLARLDAESTVRAQAISSLASINHESVFPAVLIGMADESREVRAAAARSLTHLSFDRTDAYIRVLETNDEELLRDVARACIQAGIVSQGIDRLASGDQRQSYETFSIISLLAKAKLTEPILDAVINHSNMDIRLAAVRLLTNTGEPEVFEQLRELAVRDGMGEELRTALLEAMYKLDQANVEAPAGEEQSAPSAFTGEFLFESNAEATAEPEVETDLSAEAQTQADEF